MKDAWIISDILMVSVLTAGFILIRLLINWCEKQLRKEE